MSQLEMKLSNFQQHWFKQLKRFFYLPTFTLIFNLTKILESIFYHLRKVSSMLTNKTRLQMSPYLLLLPNNSCWVQVPTKATMLLCNIDTKQSLFSSFFPKLPTHFSSFLPSVNNKHSKIRKTFYILFKWWQLEFMNDFVQNCSLNLG